MYVRAELGDLSSVRSDYSASVISGPLSMNLSPLNYVGRPVLANQGGTGAQLLFSRGESLLPDCVDLALLRGMESI